MKVLFLLPTLDDLDAQVRDYLHASSDAHAVVLATPPRDANDLPFPVTFASCRRWFDVGPLWNLRSHLHTLQPAVIHVHGLSALRWLALADWSALSRAVLSQPPSRLPGWLDRRLLYRARQIIVSEPREVDRLSALGLKNVRFVPPTADVPSIPSASRPSERIVCLGTAEVDQGFRYAVWAFDILRCLRPNLRLTLVGSELELARVFPFLDQLRLTPEIQLCLPHEESAALASSALAWVVGRGDASSPCLRALASGRALVSMNAASVVRVGETGLVVPPGDKVALAKATWKLLEDDALRQRLALAGKQSVREQYPPQAARDAVQGIYEVVAA